MYLESIKSTWVNKYKPKTIDDMILNKNIKNIIKCFTKDNINNIILYGDSGIGKTTLSHLICEYLKIDYKEYNASDTRGTNTIHEILSLYKKSKSKIIIILDEADNLTTKAQELIINIMDNYKDIKFIFTCNSYDYLLKNIMDRSIFFHLYCKEIDTYYNYVNKIVKLEKINLNKDNIEYIIKECNFDIRMIINKIEILKIIYNDLPINYKKINNFNTISCVKECICILNILFDKNKKLKDFIIEYKKKNEDGLNFIDFISISLYIFTNYNIYKNKLHFKFKKSDIIELLSILHKNNIKLLNLYIYTDLQYYNILLDLYEFSRDILSLC